MRNSNPRDSAHIALPILVMCLALAVLSALAYGAALPKPKDGSIPVGRVKRTGPPVDALITVVMSDGNVQTTRTNLDGTFSFQPMPYGSTTLTITPEDPELMTQSFVVEMGEQQSQIILVHAVPREAVTDVQGFDLEPAQDPRPRVGRQVLVRTPVRGTNARGLRPTVWIDGGIGSLTPSGNLMPSLSGRGTLRAELLGESKSVSITVE